MEFEELRGTIVSDGEFVELDLSGPRGDPRDQGSDGSAGQLQGGLDKLVEEGHLRAEFLLEERLWGTGNVSDRKSGVPEHVLSVSSGDLLGTVALSAFLSSTCMNSLRDLDVSGRAGIEIFLISSSIFNSAGKFCIRSQTVCERWR